MANFVYIYTITTVYSFSTVMASELA